MKLTKMNIIFMVLIVWAVFSLIWMGMIIWRDFQNGQMVNAANQGYQKAFVDIATATQKCEPVPLNFGVDKDGKEIVVEIIATSCLEKPAEE